MRLWLGKRFRYSYLQRAQPEARAAQWVVIRLSGVHNCSPTRGRVYARPAFFVFAFTSSPLGRNLLMLRKISVKASPRLPSPVKC